MKIRPSIPTLLYVLVLLLICPQAFAHNLWLNPENYYPQVGTTVNIGIGWGHTYPADRVDQEMKEGRLEEIRAVDPDGLTVVLTKVSTALYKLNIEKAGAYLVTAKIKPGVFTITPEGRKWGDKKSVPNPVKCTNFHIEAKTAIIAGENEKNLSRSAGQPLELIPLTPLHNLKKGDAFSIKVLYQGKPLSGLSMKATYAGFESPDTGGHAQTKKGGHADRHFPVETVTDGQGRAVVQLDKAGFWMIMISHRSPYPDKKTCDEYMYNTTFTLEVKP
jgi:uncharacterized GH25 family protein